jgi:interferon-induced transmembrane protein
VSDHGSSEPDPSDPQPPQTGQQPPYGQQYGEQPPYGQQPQYQQPYGQPPYGQQPYGSPYGQPTGGPPDNYLVWAILSTILCCWPLGIVSIVYAAQVNSKFAAGDVAGAAESSRKAKQFAIWSAAVSVVLVVVYIVIVAVVASSNN